LIGSAGSKTSGAGVKYEHLLAEHSQHEKNAGPQDTPESKELQKLRAEYDALLDRLARQQAEFDNARKRAARELQELRDYAPAETVELLLPVLDNFERAMRHADNPEDFRFGIDLIYRQFVDALHKLGVEQVPARGEPFDPQKHDALEVVDTQEAEDNQVLEELQPGYRLKDRLLRPAMVRVARNPRK
jgi:molecular chaperone GrpE